MFKYKIIKKRFAELRENRIMKKLHILSTMMLSAATAMAQEIKINGG